ncbi:unnamed protein product [Notodromas monacha]|uniref:Inosine/uridine-preferring nucleoside hydrolase domain-containing protein n=1 Tax=Notodromas monacha TaxID=399045 RepID=A0A7R9GDS1_9CRUS|nr:unnamed protein product [Notodromas monacha]CAG0917509.1 unnamed protein product [Notodromas monacha]
MNISSVLTSVLKRALSRTKWCRRPLPPPPRDAQNVMKLIIDCDAGVDDAMALIMALDYVRKGKAQVLAVTCVQGNTGLDNVVVNVLRTMNAMDIQVPVYRGAKDPLIGPYIRHGPPFHGEDGLGDAHFDTTPDLSVVSSEHASLAIARLVRDNPDEVTLIATGPLTNVALAIKMDPDFTKLLHSFYIMGGNLNGRGNITTCAEFNFHNDPEAALVTLTESLTPPRMITFDLCISQALFSLDWRKNKLGQKATRQARFQNKIEDTLLKAFEKYYGDYSMWDQVAVAAALNPGQVVTEASSACASVELAGQHTRGQMIIESRLRQDDRKNNVVIVDKIDKTALENMVLDAFD